MLRAIGYKLRASRLDEPKTGDSGY